MTPSIDIARIRQWIGRRHTQTDMVTPQLVNGFRATLGQAGSDAMHGDVAPLALHWCLAPATVPMADIGPDGHPARGGFLPPVPLPRRMWAGGRLMFHDGLLVGDRVERVSTIRDVNMKEGRSGTLCFVLVQHEICTARGLAVSEEHDIVYRGLEAPPAGPLPLAHDLGVADLSRSIAPDSVLLFRYSALTFNGHRIHYDRPYAMDVEGYPGLIVHGPLQATLLMGLAQELRPERPLRSFSFRGTSPLFDLAPFAIKARRTQDAAVLWVEGEAGVLHMRADAAW